MFKLFSLSSNSSKGATFVVQLFEDTNKIFEPPTNADFVCRHKEALMWAYLIKQDILDKHGNLGPHR